MQVWGRLQAARAPHRKGWAAPMGCASSKGDDGSTAPAHNGGPAGSAPADKAKTFRERRLSTSQLVDPNAPPPPIRFSVDDDAAKVRVEIKNQLGETVRTLQFGSTPEGAHSFTWDGKDDEGKQREPDDKVHAMTSDEPA